MALLLTRWKHHEYHIQVSSPSHQVPQQQHEDTYADSADRVDVRHS